MKWWIEHMRPGQPTEYHELNTPDVGADGFYRQVLSIDAFREREATRRFPFDADGKPLYKSVHGEPIETCRVQRYDDMLFSHKSLLRVLEQIGAPPQDIPAATEHNSVWAFYKAIGYDYKKKRYIKESE